MSYTVCLAVNTLDYPTGGGHLWWHLNWALGLRACACRVIWLEFVGPDMPPDTLTAQAATLKERLRPFGLAEALCLVNAAGETPANGPVADSLPVGAMTDADLLVNLRYDLRPELVGRFRRSVLVDIDPGVLQVWVARGEIRLAPHSLYYTIGETVGQPGARFPDAGLTWHYTPPCVALEWWTPQPTPEGAPFTTVSHWCEDDCWMPEDDGPGYANDKRSAFLPYLDLPRHTRLPLELALCLEGDETETANLREHGWRVREAHAVTATPEDYRQYIRTSRGEFSCAKPSYRRQATAWISDRTLCYLASGKPAVVEHTGPSRFLPDAAGLFRFRNLTEAVSGLETAAAEAEQQGRLARALAEEYFDARKVVGRVLERALA